MVLVHLVRLCGSSSQLPIPSGFLMTSLTVLNLSS